jgi:hypothetical protein
MVYPLSPGCTPSQRGAIPKKRYVPKGGQCPPSQNKGFVDGKRVKRACQTKSSEVKPFSAAGDMLPDKSEQF